MYNKNAFIIQYRHIFDKQNITKYWNTDQLTLQLHAPGKALNGKIRQPPTRHQFKTEKNKMETIQEFLSFQGSCNMRTSFHSSSHNSPTYIMLASQARYTHGLKQRAHLHLKQPQTALNDTVSYFIPKLWIQILKIFMLHIRAELKLEDVPHPMPKVQYSQN